MYAKWYYMRVCEIECGTCIKSPEVYIKKIIAWYYRYVCMQSGVLYAKSNAVRV